VKTRSQQQPVQHGQRQRCLEVIAEENAAHALLLAQLRAPRLHRPRCLRNPKDLPEAAGPKDLAEQEADRRGSGDVDRLSSPTSGHRRPTCSWSSVRGLLLLRLLDRPIQGSRIPAAACSRAPAPSLACCSRQHDLSPCVSVMRYVLLLGMLWKRLATGVAPYSRVAKPHACLHVTAML